ncbi:MAG: AAA family ATPase [Candidatus Chromulinivorax sp.]
MFFFNKQFFLSSFLLFFITSSMSCVDEEKLLTQEERQKMQDTILQTQYQLSLLQAQAFKQLQNQSIEQNNSFFSNCARYFSSDLGISTALGVGTTLFVSMSLILFQIYTQQKTMDLIGNQSMQIYYPGDIQFKLADVAGAHGAKADLQDIISYLLKPKAFKKIGAEIPKGVLMEGLPGNGKTLLAKAVAGQVNCPFISVAGSSFIQMYVGLGAARVRDLFVKAQQLAEHYGACIIFIDEIDALGAKRINGLGSHREDDQTIAQLLECMDGLSKHENPIIVLGATNRVDILDDALIRPGRFDRIVKVDKPEFKDRIELINIALKKVVHRADLDIITIARMTSDFSGAQIVNLINEAAILAVNAGRKSIQMSDINLAFDHITLGREIIGRQQSVYVQRETAYHEAGHVIGWLYAPSQSQIILKASIVNRAHTLGIVWHVPLQEKFSWTEQEMKETIIVALCGGCSEQVFGFGKSAGVSSDLRQARNIAFNMVVKYGMSPKLNYVSYDEILQNLPDSTAKKVYDEVERIIAECLQQAHDLIRGHKKEIEIIAHLLLDKGTVSGEEIYNAVGLPIPQIPVEDMM